jgi:SAM-dependent methyltransferase
MTTYQYDNEFFDYITLGSRRSARVVVKMLLEQIPVHAVLDVGCGRGAWLAEWRKQGVTDVLGVDGSYVEPATLEIPQTQFQAANLAEPLDLGRKFDLVESLEVAEHIPERSADIFVQNLVAHGDLILFSAAPPGQGGEYHVNEQEYGYWRQKFAQFGYHFFDFVRPQLLNNPEVEPWYRYNTLLFVRDSKIHTLPAAIRTTQVAPERPVKEYGSWIWRLRRSLVSRLPNSVVSAIAIAKHYLVLAVHRLKKSLARSH